jgi:hypothetical protein
MHADVNLPIQVLRESLGGPSSERIPQVVGIDRECPLQGGRGLLVDQEGTTRNGLGLQPSFAKPPEVGDPTTDCRPMNAQKYCDLADGLPGLRP